MIKIQDRNYIIERLKSKTMSIDEFNFDKLQAPPISSMFTFQDISKLNSIARSIKYSAKPEVKYREIDQIMRKRGFEKFIGGTNRITYRPVEDNSFLIKVATDAVGLGDNPREFQNQMIFKPFVTKVFEITPCGTIGVFERVVPITSREEFYSIGKDVYEVINNWFIGEYVLEDIGTKFFMNWGVRKGFGPVLLDFPYVYKLDGNKLFCNAPDPNNPSGCCEGVIDYDPGFNFLYCTKCGVKYKAKELAKAVEEKRVIVKAKGDIKMKIEIKGGNKNIEKQISTGETLGNVVSNIPGLSTKLPVVEKVAKRGGINKDNTEIKKETKDVAKTPEQTPTTPKKGQSNKKTTPPKKNSKSVPKKEAGKSKAPAECPIEFDESLIKKDSEKEVSKIEFVNNLLSEILKVMEEANEDERGVIFNSVTTAFKEQIDKAVEASNAENSEKEFVDDVESTPEQLFGYLSDSLTRANYLISEIVQKTGKEYNSFLDNNIKNLIDVNDINDEFAHILFRVLFDERFRILFDVNNDIYYDEEKESIVCEIIGSIARDNEEDEDGDPIFVYDFGNDIQLCFLAAQLAENLAEAGYDLSVPLTDENFQYGDLKYFGAKIINAKDLFEDKQSCKILVIVNDDNNYLTVGNEHNIVAVDVIDDRSVDCLSLVSSEWLNKAILESKADENNEEVTEDQPEDEVEETTTPTGVFAPTMKTVNGVPVEEVEKEETNDSI